MPIKDASYPAKVWDGNTPNNPNRTVNAAPNANDWNQMISELIASQVKCDTNEAAALAFEVLRVADREFTAVADNSAVVIAGAPVYMKTAGTIAYSIASGGSVVAKNPIGLLKTGGADSLSYVSQSSGIMVLTTGEWDAVTGDSGGLTPGAKYFLDASPAGRLVTVAPAASGEWVIRIGVGLSTTQLLLQFDFEKAIP